MRATASAPGKVILFGEHFVVKDQPAIAVAVSLRAYVTATLLKEKTIRVYSRNLALSREYTLPPADDKNPLYPVAHAAFTVLNKLGAYHGISIEIDSEIPPSAGMGSSAAVSVATIAATAKAMGEDLRLEEISRMAYEAERIVHGRPSGIDNTIATYGGAIAYRKSEGFLRLNVDFKDVSLILADTGKPRSTGLLVKRVLDLYDAFPSVLEPIYYAAGRLAVEAAKMMERGDWEAVGALMNVNHGLLSAIGVSTIELEQIVYAAREAGALGAKLTGAGGGGYAVILCKRDHEGKIIEELRKVSPRLLKLNVENTGVSTSL